MAASVVETNTVHHTFQSLLGSLTPEQMAMFRKQLGTTSVPKPHTTPSSQVELMESDDMNDANRSYVPLSRLEKAQQAKARQKEAEAKRRRPTNCFMVFRAYLAPLFPQVTQKAISGLISQLWAEETRRHFFTLLAQAHTELRDNHLGRFPFPEFLAIAVPLLPLPPADSYLMTMGWIVTTNINGGLELEKSDHTPSLRQGLKMTSMVSARDVIERCYEAGIAARPVRKSRSNPGGTPSMKSGMAMSIAAAPRANTAIASNDQVSTAGGQQLVDPAIRERIESPVTPPSSEGPDFDFNDLGSCYRPSMAVVAADQQQAYERHPFAVHFHPSAPVVVGWDPEMIQDDFDPFTFDLADFVNFEL